MYACGCAPFLSLFSRLWELHYSVDCGVCWLGLVGRLRKRAASVQSQLRRPTIHAASQGRSAAHPEHAHVSSWPDTLGSWGRGRPQHTSYSSDSTLRCNPPQVRQPRITGTPPPGSLAPMLSRTILQIGIPATGTNKQYSICGTRRTCLRLRGATMGARRRRYRHTNDRHW